MTTAGIERRTRVLIVDDERVITDTLVTIFSQRGYETKGVYSAEQALAFPRRLASRLGSD